MPTFLQEKDFELYFRTHFQGTVRTIRRYVKSIDTAEELAQEAFLRAWRERASLTNVSSWIHKTARNLALDELRRRSFRPILFSELGKNEEVS